MANCLKNRNFSEICPEKSIILVKLSEKIEIISPESTTPQFSNQIDAAAGEVLCYNIICIFNISGLKLSLWNYVEKTCIDFVKSFQKIP